MLRAFGSPKLYLQGPGAIEALSDVLCNFGRRFFVVIDPIANSLVGPLIRQQVNLIGGEVVIHNFSGECSSREIDRLTALCLDFDSDAVLGVGGGKAIDTAKGVQINSNKPIIIIPSVASNDSPTSRLCVVYTDDHILEEVRKMNSNPDAIIVDTGILINAPVRYFVSGVGDAISKMYESSQCWKANGDNFYSHKPPYIALELAEKCHEVIMHHAESALRAVLDNEINDSFERTVEATVLLSGLAFENGGLSIPHSLTRGLSIIEELHSSLHGEQVAYGLLVQLVMEKRSYEDIKKLIIFYRAVGLPTCLNELGYKEDASKIINIIASETVLKATYIKNFPEQVTEKLLSEAMLEVERMTIT